LLKYPRVVWHWEPRKFNDRKVTPNGKTPNMKACRILSLFAGFVVLVGATRAAEETRTITGDAMCAKCELNLQKNCQTVIQVKEDGRVVTYYLAANDAARAFHPNICKGPARATVTGTVAIIERGH
jgi:hypothetical protein